MIDYNDYINAICEKEKLEIKISSSLMVDSVRRLIDQELIDAVTYSDICGNTIIEITGVHPELIRIPDPSFQNFIYSIDRKIDSQELEMIDENYKLKADIRGLKAAINWLWVFSITSLIGICILAIS